MSDETSTVVCTSCGGALTATACVCERCGASQELPTGEVSARGPSSEPAAPVHTTAQEARAGPASSAVAAGAFDTDPPPGRAPKVSVAATQRALTDYVAPMEADDLDSRKDSASAKSAGRQADDPLELTASGDESTRPGAPKRTPGWGWCAGIAGFSLFAAFSEPVSLVYAVIAGGYGYHLYNGGRDFTGYMADGRRRSRAWLIWAAIALTMLIAGFTYPACLLVALVTGGYAAYLFSGGRDVTREAGDGSGRSIAWMYYAAITCVAAVIGFSAPIVFVVAAVTGMYTVYLFQGGRWVLWFW